MSAMERAPRNSSRNLLVDLFSELNSKILMISSVQVNTEASRRPIITVFGTGVASMNICTAPCDFLVAV